MNRVQKLFSGVDLADTSPVTLINSFSVDEQGRSLFLESWDEHAGYFRRQAGFLEARFHESFDAQRGWTFVNVARWATARALHAALHAPDFSRMSRLPVRESEPILYREIRKL